MKSGTTELDSEIEGKVDSLLSLMTLEEKIGQMNQYSGFWDVTGPKPEGGSEAKKYEDLRKGLVGSMLNVTGAKEVLEVQKIAVEETRLGIPLLIGFDVVHGFKTVSPIPLAESASWDMEAIKRSAEVAAKEAAVSGINWTFAPMVDITRDARWGRVMEGAGEDPFLGSAIAKARVTGFQGDDLTSPYTIAACAKHFAAYGFAESGRDYNTVDVGTSTLYNIVFPPFLAAKEAGVRTFMNSFNEINGVPATGNAWLQREILKGKWDFNGFMVSDWGSINEMISHGQAENGKYAAERAIIAGSDMDMESYHYLNYLAELVKEGKVNEDLLDDAVRRILRVKFELGLFENPYQYSDPSVENEVVGSQEIQDAVLDMAKKSIVLLKNEKRLLPLKRSGQNIVVIGALASDKTSPLGNWRTGAENGTAVSLLEGLQQYQGNTITYVKGPAFVDGEISFPKQLQINETKTSGMIEAVNAAKKADIVLVALGEHGMQTGEGRSQVDIGLPKLQQQLLEEVYKANPNVVLVLHNGRPVAIPWAAEHIPSILEVWQLGTQSGHAIAQVLYGDYNPSGKLPMTFPKAVGQVPIYYNHKSTGRPNEPAPGEVFWSHYTDMDNDPLFPFGHGLSYTQFEYQDLKVEVDPSQVLVSFELKNIGGLDGKEVVQVYIQDVFASITRPVKELKGFELVSLKAGESKTLNFILTDKELGFYNNQGEFFVEPGDFKVFVGGSSNTVLESEFNLAQQLR
ncbi:beta-glucosidase BglX [Mangrovimonas sp. AS39]|nr:beta-glucosidase BglX [Mangrovimonas futianensis]MCF1192972.1 beta-glucosidase BglX [Mangrovimonas futianensis]MCF1196663.1 beta-glucosidase BglX [Mangrovimonas futianensis]